MSNVNIFFSVTGGVLLAYALGILFSLSEVQVSNRPGVRAFTGVGPS